MFTGDATAIWRQRPQHLHHLDRCTGRAQRSKRRRARRPHEDVHANAGRARLRSVQHAQHDGCDGKNHHHFNGHCKRADERAQRPVDQVADNQFVHVDGPFLYRREKTRSSNSPAIAVVRRPLPACRTFQSARRGWEKYARTTLLPAAHRQSAAHTTGYCRTAGLHWICAG